MSFTTVRYDIDQLIQYFDRSIISLIETIEYKNDIALKLKAHEIHSVDFLQEVRTSRPTWKLVEIVRTPYQRSTQSSFINKSSHKT